MAKYELIPTLEGSRQGYRITKRFLLITKLSMATTGWSFGVDGSTILAKDQETARACLTHQVLQNGWLLSRLSRRMHDFRKLKKVKLT